MSERTARRRVRKLLSERHLLLLEVGAHAQHDRVVSTYIERDGATVLNPEYAAIIREIVRVARDR